MKGKKNAFHPKSYPVPAQLPATAAALSRNQYATNVVKGGTLQVPPKAYVPRTAKSPTTNSKKPFDIPANPSPKLMMLAKQPFAKQMAPVPPKVIKPDPNANNKSLKKSLSNNDIQIVSAAPAAAVTGPKLEQQRTLPGKPPIQKRHSPSPTQQLKSPSPPRTAGTTKVATKTARPVLKGKISEFQPTTTAKLITAAAGVATNTSPQNQHTSPAPWIDFLY